MTTPLPVVLTGPPFERPHPRVTVARQRGCVNAGDGRRARYVVRYVVDNRTRVLLDAQSQAAAGRRAGALVRRRRPQAVWVLDAGQTAADCWLHWRAWRPLSRAAKDVQAAFVAWTAATDGSRRGHYSSWESSASSTASRPNSAARSRQNSR